MQIFSPPNEKIINSTFSQSDLKILETQLSYETMIIKKYNQYAELCEDAQLKKLCHQGAKKHKQNYEMLLNFLNIHQ